MYTQLSPHLLSPHLFEVSQQEELLSKKGGDRGPVAISADGGRVIRWQAERGPMAMWV